jgi:2-amino-4-hydroxy-6-hydroxymethyldihydropteridine diphosphokinase
VARAYVGVGSNLGDSAGIVRAAFDRLRTLGNSFVNSDLYLAQPWGVEDQPAFINAVVAFDTDLSARDLLRRLHAIEAEFGRERRERWGPRTLDLDLLLLGDERIDEPDLKVPHEGLASRAFVLEPLAEVAPNTVAMQGRTAADLLASLTPQERRGVIRLEGTAKLVPPPRVDYDAPGGAGGGYDTLRPFSRFDRAVLDAAVEAAHLTKGDRVLDVGCGTGRFSERLRELGFRVTGYDPSETMLAAARARAAAGRATAALPLIEYVRGDANESLPAGPFNAITAFYCIHYIDVKPFARRALKVLADEGVLAIATFPHRHFAEVIYARYFPSLPAIDMARFPSAQMLAEDLEQAGFADIAQRDIHLELEDDPQALTTRIEHKFLSSFFLIPDDEFRRGLVKMREDWRDRSSVRRSVRAMIVSGRAPSAAKR